MNEIEDCPICGAGGKVALHTDTYVAYYNATSISLPEITRCKCLVCGEKFFTPQQSIELSRRVKEVAK